MIDLEEVINYFEMANMQEAEVVLHVVSREVKRRKEIPAPPLVVNTSTEPKLKRRGRPAGVPNKAKVTVETPEAANV